MRISVCMATYNGAAYLREQIDSILPQLGMQDELIISDDGSVDGTLGIVCSYRDNRIRIVESDSCKKGPAFNFENALKQAKGDIVFLSDQDDVWMPEKVEVLCKALEKNDLVFSDAYVVNHRGDKLREHFFITPPSLGCFKNLMFNHYFGATMAFKRQVLEKALPFPDKIPMHDQWLGIVARYYFSTAFIDKPLIKYRRHGENASFCGERSSNSWQKKIMFRIRICWAFLGRIV